MIQARTDNPGILEAIREMKVMGLGKNLRMLYEAHMKEIRDRNARDAYVYDEGKAEGKAEGQSEDVIVLLSELGCVSEKLCNIIRSQRDEEVLKIWLRTAAKAESIEEFVELLQITL